MDINSNVELRTGSEMPIIGLGTWELDKDTEATIRVALDMGYRMIDTSGDYGTQPGIGEGFKRADRSRDSFYLITKVEEDDNAYEATRKGLQELGLEYADLMLIHRPPEQGAGEELWRGLMRAKGEGLARDIGVSNYSIEQIQQLIDNTGEVPVVNQIEWSPFGYSPEMQEFCQSHDIVIQAYSPLTRGERLENEVLVDITDKYEKTPAQILIRWNLQLGIVPIVKANSHDHLEQNLQVFDFELSRQDMIRLAELNEQYSALSDRPVYMEA